MINQACLDNRLVGLRLGVTGPMISHLLFANDSLFFLKASMQNCRRMMSIINEYCAASD